MPTNNPPAVIVRPTKYNPVPFETKAYILADADLMIRDGHTLVEISSKHGLEGKTLDSWLAEETDQVKLQAWTTARLQHADALLDKCVEYSFGADSEKLSREQIQLGQLRLSTARAKAMQTNFIAERRDARYAQKQEVKATVTNTDGILQSRAIDLIDIIERGMRAKNEVVVDG